MDCFLKKFAVAAFVAMVGWGVANAITPNKLVSGGVKAWTGGSTTNFLTDGYFVKWNSGVTNEIAMNVGVGPTKLRIQWEYCSHCAWGIYFTKNCQHTGEPLSNFQILTSANSTDGHNGDWVVAATIRDNPVMSRAIEIDFAGRSWFKFVSDSDLGKLLEIEAFDVSEGGDDTWFFMGTSITQMGLKMQETDSTVAQLIHARFPEYTPAVLRGGIGCINSTEIVSLLDRYLKYAGNVKYWAIEMGTNDAWGGSDWQVKQYARNMQRIVDSAKAHGITPIIARIIATDPARAGWQVHPAYLNALDKIIKVNRLPEGPDFYNFFLQHKELLADDGVHPKAEGGGQAMHRLWAEALAPLYESSRKAKSSIKPVKKFNSAVPKVYADGREVFLSGLEKGASVRIVSAIGRVVVRNCYATEGRMQLGTLPAGKYFVIIRSPKMRYFTNLLVK